MSSLLVVNVPCLIYVWWFNDRINTLQTIKKSGSVLNGRWQTTQKLYSWKVLLVPSRKDVGQPSFSLRITSISIHSPNFTTNNAFFLFFSFIPKCKWILHAVYWAQLQVQASKIAILGTWTTPFQDYTVPFDS